jgi:hypothetical protein
MIYPQKIKVSWIPPMGTTLVTTEIPDVIKNPESSKCPKGK